MPILVEKNLHASIIEVFFFYLFGAQTFSEDATFKENGSQGSQHLKDVSVKQKTHHHLAYIDKFDFFQEWYDCLPCRSLSPSSLSVSAGLPSPALRAAQISASE